MQPPPPEPQFADVLPPLQLVPLQQPLHLLLGQVLPQPSAAPWHLPLQLGVQLVVQVPLLQTLPLAHLTQAPPDLPQSPLLVPGWQRLPSQQPLQLLLSHFVVFLHAPLSQVPPLAWQSRQAEPALPQAVSLIVSVHDVPAQQPLQSFLAHGLPQPLSAPWHFPEQLGVQLRPSLSLLGASASG